MKLIKKIAAIMFAFIMVFTLSSNVNAEETKGTGKIIINQAVDKAEYKIYKLLTLESCDKINNIYSYKIDSKWVNFFEQKDIKNTYVATENGYVTKWIGDGTENETRMQEFTKKALEYAKNPANGITATNTKNAEGDSVTFDNLGLGYYLVDSSSGALCGLTTTDNEIIIKEKNKAPTVKKEGKFDTDANYKSNSLYAEILENINFKISFTVTKGVENYVLHDIAENGISIKLDTIKVAVNGKDKAKNEYTLTRNPNDKCTFDIDFKNILKEDDQVSVTYDGYLNSDAKIFDLSQADTTGNVNKTYLTYGHSNKSNESKLNIYTYSMPVFKYTSETDTTEKGLGDVEFKLSKDKNGENSLSFLKGNSKTDDSGNTIDVYTLVSENTEGSTQVIKTSKSGYFTLNGLHGDYYLTETKALPGYNSLDKPIRVKVGDGGLINVDSETKSSLIVKVLNNKGSLLPSTGGMGTTLIYLIGAALVLGSGIVLANKKRAKAK